MKKLIPLFLATMLLVTSCGSTQPSDGSPQPTGEVKQNEPGVKEKKELDVMLWYRDMADFQNMEFYKELEAQTGIHANLTAVSGADWSTKTNLMFTSGEYPDIILRGGVDIEMYGVDQKILLPMDDYIEQHMPVYKALLDYEPGTADLLRASDGKMYRLGWRLPQNINVNAHLFVNKLWLDNLGLSIPTTLKEYEDMLIAFKDRDPNKNGEKDEIPFTGTLESSVDATLYLLSFWGIPYNSNWIMINNDNQVTSQLLSENMREALETLNKWYSTGLMDVECVAQDTASFEPKVNAASAGSFWRWRMKAMSTEPDVVAQYQGIVPVAAEGLTAQLPEYLELPSFGAALTIGCEDIETACAWLDAQFEFENQMNGYYGKYKEETVNNVVTQYGWRYNDQGKVEFFTADLEEVPNQSALHFFSGTEYFEKVIMPEQRIEKTELCKLYTEAGVVEKYSSSILTSLCKFTLEEIGQRDLLQAEIKKYAQEAIVGFITKGVTDAGWDAYVKTLDNLKINDYIRLYQEVYERYQESVK